MTNIKIIVEKNGKQQEVDLKAPPIGEQIDLFKAHGEDLQEQLTQYFGKLVVNTLMEMDD